MRSTLPLKILLHHWNAANREVTRRAASDLEESDAFSGSVLLVPVHEINHCLDAVLYDVRSQLALYHVGCEDVACRAVLPSGNDDRNVLFASGENPAVFRVDLDRKSVV